MKHPYLPQTPEDQAAMLKVIGAEKLDDLLAPIPADLRLKGGLDLPAGQTEPELKRHFQKLANRNQSTGEMDLYIGAGAYEHYIPSVTRHLAGRSEFYTAYTPYQPEMTQGVLQSIYEYQSCICALTGMDVSNASLYEGGHAVAEACLMARSATRRNKIVLSAGVHPEYAQVLKTYTKNLETEVVQLPLAADGRSDLDALKQVLGDDSAALVLQQPSFFGTLEDAQAASDLAHAAGALLIAVVEPVSLGLLQAPSEYGADIVAGEGQSLGLHLQFGGPWLGFIACKQEQVRRMPGRICGITTDNRDQRAFVLTLQTREQHIRREKATSNICTNQTLLSIMATIYLSALGPHGLKEVAAQGVQKAHYLAEGLGQMDGVSLPFGAPFFNEFVVEVPGSVESLLQEMRGDGIFGGLPLSRFFPDRDQQILVCVTETKTRNQLNHYLRSFGEHVGT